MESLLFPCCECCGGRQHTIGHPSDPCSRHQRQPRKPRRTTTVELPQEAS